MNQSFYTAALGASAQQDRINVISNNLANVNTYGFKAKRASFTNMIAYDVNKGAGEGKSLRTEVGTTVLRTDTDFSEQGYIETDLTHDYAIVGDGFFMVQDPVTGENSYTRNGHFSLYKEDEETFYLVTDSGKRVMNSEGEYYVPPIKIVSDEEEDYEYEEEDEDEEEKINIGIYRFAHPSQLLNSGDGEFTPVNGAEPVAVENGKIRDMLLDKRLEMSGTDITKEFSQMIISQRAYAYALKMVTTSDEIEQTVNSLRG